MHKCLHETLNKWWDPVHDNFLGHNHTFLTNTGTDLWKCRVLTVGSLRSRGASKRGHVATINLIQFHILRQLGSSDADPGITKAKHARIWFPSSICHTGVNTSKLTDRAHINHVSFTVFHAYYVFMSWSIELTMHNSVVTAAVTWKGLC